MRSLILTLALSLPLGAKIDFATQVQPILSNNCYACHGPDEAAAEADLRLDQRELALKGGDSGSAITPGDASNSLLIQRVTTTDPDDHMPPLGKKDPLTPEQISILTDWINEGAEWGTHWAFSPPTRPTPPDVKNTTWPKNDIDRFILAQLESADLQPSAPAKPRTLLRRLHLDLVGLPPSLSDLSTFQISNLDSQISNLLSSPHHGEKWGREWLDVARYADSAGYEKDLPREMHFYRDWVVNAINSDMSYDDFVIKQIAGDLLPNATRDDHIATGYLRHSMANEEAGAKLEQFRIEGIYDQMDAIGKGVLGITTQCAQCHTHKYDPLTHDEYFGMFAYLNSIRETSRPAYSKTDHQKIARIKKATSDIESRLKSETPAWQADFRQWQSDLLALPRTEWIVQDLAQFGDDGQKYQNRPDGSLINQGYAATMMTAPFQHQPTTLDTVSSVRIELLNDPYLSLNGPGRSMAGTAALSEYQLKVNGKNANFKNAAASVNPPDAKLDPMRYPLNAERGPDDRITGHAAYAIDGNDKTAWTTDQGPGRSNDPQVLVFELTEPLQNAPSLDLKTFLSQRHGGINSDDNQTFNIGRFRLSFSSAIPNAFDSLPPLVKEALTAEKRTPEQESRLFSHWRSLNPNFASYNEQIESLWKSHPVPAVALVASKVASPRVTRLLDRGDYTQPKHEVTPHVPAFLNPLPEGDPHSRLTFAKWLVAPDSPTAARTLVNRIWQSYFSTGLLETPEDLGLQSPRPSHPELLDWLAVELMENDWSMKHIHRLIVSSATYQQDSTHKSLLREKDPKNRLLARGPRFRVPAETLRDIQLTTSGLINLDLGGRCVFPPAPAFLFQKPASYGPKIWHTEMDSQRYRRALYTFRFRSVPYPMLAAFDAATGDAACVRRTISTTPLQALVTLNESMSVEAAVALGARILETSIAQAFEHCTSRPPNTEELAVLQNLFDQQKQNITPESATQLITTYKPLPLDLKTHNPVHLAAATAVAQTLLNLDETMTKN
ncbi:MAG: PSD1 and planctomycete cytochrome C domain-containing protein [Verrucomicrobiaceae bacterium]